LIDVFLWLIYFLFFISLCSCAYLLSGREAAVWEVEERFLLESGAMKKQQIQQLYDLLRRQLAFRRGQV
jgi:hypothetical protein